ncbi:hypothetical protein [Posidoniimonas polymericola]|nr:hypothetical protein [Posidoniimonas polymericola]
MSQAFSGGQGLPAASGAASPGDSDLSTPFGASPYGGGQAGSPPLPVPGLPSTTSSPPPATATPPAQRPATQYPPVTRTPTATAPTGGSGSSASRVYHTDELMTGIMKRPGSSNLSGTPVRLEQVVASGGDRSQQTQRINAYWDLCSSVADYYLGLHEASELNRHQQRLGGRNAEISQAAQQWQTRIGTSQLAAVAAQRRLAALMGASSLPLPGDLPLCGEYNTKYPQAFAGRDSQEARVLDQLIPLRYAELASAAAEVSRLQDFLQDVNQQSVGGEGVLKAFQLLALQRRAFVQIAKDYNRQITRYTELSTPGNIATGRLVAMLVERTRTASAPQTSSAQSSAAGMPPTRPQTFRRGLQ